MNQSDRSRRSLKETITSILVLAFVYGTASLIENQLGANLVDLFPVEIRDNILWSWGISLATLTLLIPLLVIVQNSLADNPLSRCREWLKYILEVLAGALSAFSAILGNDVVINIGPLDELILRHRPQSSLVLFALLAILLIAVPAIRFWITRNNLLGIRDAKKLLDVLEARASAHLSNHMTVRERRFDLDVNPLPGAVDPVSVPTAPAGALDRVNVTTSDGIEMSPAPPPPPRDEGKTARDLWKIFHLDYCAKKDQRQLLILGEPGGGKSTQLYLLDQQLTQVSSTALSLIHAKHDSFVRRQFKRLLFWRYQAPNHEIPCLPVMLDLSTWPTTHAPLDKWIVDATVRNYGIHRRAAQEWMNTGRFLPLLDALDVMEVSAQPECVSAINTYLEDDHSRPLVVCCRMDEYQLIRDPKGTSLLLKLRHAVQLGMVDPGEVRRRLHRAPALVAAANQDQKLMKTLQVPLLLNLALLNLDDIIAYQPTNDWGPVLFKDYVKNMMRRETPTAPYEETELMLAWLGNELKENRELVFLTSDLQRDSLPAQSDRDRFDRYVAAINSVLKLGLGSIPVIGAAAIVVKVYGVGGGRVFEPGGGSPLVTIAITIAGIIGALGLGMGVRNADNHGKIDLERHQAQDHSPADITRLNRWHLLVDRVIRAQVGRWQTLAIIIWIWLIVTIVIQVSGGLGLGRFGALIVGLTVGLLIGGLIGPDGGLFSKWGKKQDPDYLLRNAARQAFRILLFYTLIGLAGGSIFAGLLITAFAGQSLHLGDAIQWGLEAAEFGGGYGALAVGLSVGLDSALKNGGVDALLHFALRVALRTEFKKKEVSPQKLVQFLEAASMKTLLRREGRGYTFIVRSETLRDFFANLYWTKYYANNFAPAVPDTLKHKRIPEALGPSCPHCLRHRNWVARKYWDFMHLPPRSRRPDTEQHLQARRQ